MHSHTAALRELIAEGLYVVDERLVAEAILARGQVHATVANTSFNNQFVLRPPVRSFRRDPHARSFRLERSSRSRH